ncbi:hypothetical protein CKAN_02256200 [Cinnamomum micranthum f. kanehirae]|uniref:SWIM-type domain-containing protein n=1 Tax=Cinnamomum micranthum f. kanehirae TaxID=337451 RepID=A0A443PRB7_9MAGN|nr:hypothetical protein CKAN_02256200 [Cinnamomum micranthum f. kanehirae]
MRSFIIKYFLPNNKRTLITISNDKGLQRMVDFHEDSDNIDVYILAGETTTPSFSNKVDQRSNRNESRPTTKATRVKAASRPPNRTRNITTITDPVTTTVATALAFGDVAQPRPIVAVNDVEQPRPIVAVNDVEQPSPIVAVNDVEQPRPIAVVVANDVEQPRVTVAIDSIEQPELGISISDVGDVGQPVDAAIVDNVGQAVVISSCDGTVAGVGQEFNNARDFRNALRKYAITRGFVLQYVKNESARVTAKCKANGCPWRVHASRLPKMQRFRLRKINDEHTCGGGVGKDGHPQATNHWIASIVKEKLRVNPQLKPREIAEDISRDYGINLKYHKVWRGREVAMEELQAFRANAYNRLPWFCDRIRETNPGSIVVLATTDDSRFHRLFVSFRASQHGFENGCRPLLFLNGISLKDKYLGTLLTASSVDAEDGIFPVAFAIVDAESYDNWYWFLVELKSALSMTHRITFVSDRNNGLEEAVPRVFADCYHGFSLYHVMEDFKKQLAGLFQQPVKDAMVEQFRGAAYASRVPDFNECISNMRKVSHDVATWVLSSKCECWSNAFFGGMRYNYYSSNIAESFFNSWIPEEHDLSIIQMLDMLRCKMMEMIYTRREASRTWSTTLTPSSEEKLQIEIFNSRDLNVLISSDTVFEVRDNTVNIVNIETWDCTCQQWKMAGLPCIHAVAVLDHTGRNIYDYCSRYFTVEAYRATYLESINPVPDVEKPVQDDSTAIAIVNPPIRRICRPPGRPKQKRTDLQVPRKRLRPLHCSRCKGAGHNKKTCSEYE